MQGVTAVPLEVAQLQRRDDQTVQPISGRADADGVQTRSAVRPDCREKGQPDSELAKEVMAAGREVRAQLREFAT